MYQLKFETPSEIVSPINVEGHISLIAAVMKLGLKEEGPEYLQTLGGYHWCQIGGIDPMASWEKAVKGYWGSYVS